MTRTCEAVALHLRVPRAMGSRWAAELGWSPGHDHPGRAIHTTLTVGRAVGLEVYGTLVRQHRDHRRWQWLAQAVAGHVDHGGPARWMVQTPGSPAARAVTLYRDDELDQLVAEVEHVLASGWQVIVVDLHQLTARWADSPECPPPRSSPSSSSPPSSSSRRGRS